jgi:hypothetical protein
VLEHAYHGARDRKVSSASRETARHFESSFAIAGPGGGRARGRLDLQRYVSERRTGGLGIHLMEKDHGHRSFRREGRRNVCCLVKRKHSGEPEGA